MNREKALKWAAALRSGEFKQGRGRLRTSDGGHCCLGVACELYRRETGNGKWVRYPSGELRFAVDGKECDLILPSEVRYWLEVGTGDVLIPHTNIRAEVGVPPFVYLTTLNDGSTGLDIKPQDFNTIADVIEMISDDL